MQLQIRTVKPGRIGWSLLSSLSQLNSTEAHAGAVSHTRLHVTTRDERLTMFVKFNVRIYQAIREVDPLDGYRCR